MANNNFDHRTLVKSNWPELLKRIDTNTGLQGELKKCTREFPAMFIRSVWDNRDTTVRTDKLLTHLMNGGKARFDWFCDSLCMSGQHTIVDVYLKPQPAVPLDDQLDAVPVVVQTTAAASPATSATTCRQGSDEFLRADSLNNLRKHWNELYGDIRSDHEFLGELVSRLVFTEMQIKKLKDTDQEMDRNDLMLHWLEKGSQATFIGFCEALTITKQDQLRRSLMPTADARTVSSNIFNTTDVSDDTAAASSAADVSVPAESTAVEESTATAVLPPESVAVEESAGSSAVEESARSSAVEESARSSAVEESAESSAIQESSGMAMPCTEAPELNNHARRNAAYVYQSADQAMDTDDQFVQEVIDKIHSEDVTCRWECGILLCFGKGANVVTKQVNELKKAYEIKLSLSGKRGRVLIINNIIFKNATDAYRKGAEVDEKNLQALFVNLQYEVVVHRNKTIKEIQNILEGERKHEDHKLADSFVLFVLSHGVEDNIFGTDNQLISLKGIMKYFNGTNCPHLIEKPKLFFVQACQGKIRSPGLPCTRADAMPELPRQMENLNGNEAESGDDPDVLSEASMAKLVHEERDHVLVVSAVEGHVAFRCEEAGSFFVQSICDVFMKRARCNDLVSMLTEINRDMSQRVTHCEGQLCVPLSETRNNTLSGNVYLLPAEILQRFYDKRNLPTL